jgi:hypothetical protein
MSSICAVSGAGLGAFAKQSIPTWKSATSSLGSLLDTVWNHLGFLSLPDMRLHYLLEGPALLFACLPAAE